MIGLKGLLLAHAWEAFLNPPDNRQNQVGDNEANDKRYEDASQHPE